jgi:hypothetical protein
MKIRSDFVTNSSSSSFILSFKDEDSIYKTLKEQFPTDIENGWSAGEFGYLHQLLNDIENADRLTKEDLVEIILDESWHIRWEIEERLKRREHMSREEVSDYFNTDEGKKVLERAYQEQIDKVMSIIGDNKVIVQVEHGDGGDGEDGVLEHEILPSLDCTAKRFSHH